MDIRKISIGADYKSSAMHYIAGQEVLGGTYRIHLIQKDLNINHIKFGLKKSMKFFYGKNLILNSYFN